MKMKKILPSTDWYWMGVEVKMLREVEVRCRIMEAMCTVPSFRLQNSANGHVSEGDRSKLTGAAGTQRQSSYENPRVPR
jgi:hypothetical protein